MARISCKSITIGDSMLVTNEKGMFDISVQRIRYPIHKAEVPQLPINSISFYYNMDYLTLFFGETGLYRLFTKYHDELYVLTEKDLNLVKLAKTKPIVTEYKDKDIRILLEFLETQIDHALKNYNIPVALVDNDWIPRYNKMDDYSMLEII